MVKQIESFKIYQQKLWTQVGAIELDLVECPQQHGTSNLSVKAD